MGTVCVTQTTCKLRKRPNAALCYSAAVCSIDTSPLCMLHKSTCH